MGHGQAPTGGGQARPGQEEASGAAALGTNIRAKMAARASKAAATQRACCQALWRSFTGHFRKGFQGGDLGSSELYLHLNILVSFICILIV